MRFLNPILVGALALGSSVAWAQTHDNAIPGDAGGGAPYTPVPYVPQGNALQDQRALLVTHPGGGSGGADGSRLQTALGMNTIGFGVQQTVPNRLADDFVVPAGGWNITSFTVYSYQTGSTTTPTHNGITFRIWSGIPGAMGSTVVFGDTTTNRFTSAAFSNIFRTTDTAPNDTTRPIMAVTAGNLNINLPAGTYWLDFALSGTLASGPWGPPITVNGQTVTGNALQFTNSTGLWNPANDTGTGTPQQGIPFSIDGTLPGADLSITLTDAPDPVTAGTNLTYTATVSNPGPGAATDVSASLPLPAGTTFVSSTATGGTCTTPAVGANGTVTCTWAGATAIGATRTMTVVAAVAASATGSLNATATTTSATIDPNPANNSATATTAISTSADLSVTLTASASAVPVNVPVTFTATSTNNGPSDAQNVTVTVTLSPDFRYSSHTAAGATSCTTPQIGNSGSIVCTWNGATAPGASRVLSVIAYSNNENNNTVTASTGSATIDPNAANNTAAVSVVVGELIEEVPTLSQFALMLLGLLVGLVGFAAVRRQA